MSRAVWLSLVVVLLGGVAGLWFWFDEGPGTPVGTAPLRPGESATSGRSMSLPEPLESEAAGPTTMELARAAPTATTSDDAPADGALLAERRVSGVVLRASDRTPLARAYVTADRDERANKSFQATEEGVSQPSVMVVGDGEDEKLALAMDYVRTALDGDERFEDPPPPLAGKQVGRHWRTGDDGRFAFDVPADADELLATFQGRRARVSLAPGTDPVDDLVLVVDSGFRIAGQVLDQDGAPVDGARVEIDGLPWVGARSSVGGGFTLRDVIVDAERSHVDVRASAPWYERGQAPALVPGDVTTLATVEVRLVGAGALEGILADIDGRGVKTEVILSVHSTDGHGEPHGEPHDGWLRGQSDERGHFRVEGVPAGTWLVEVASRSPLAGRWQPGVVVAVAETTHLDVTLHRSASLSGRVIDEGGTPVVGASVVLERIESWQADGIRGTWITGRNDSHLVSSLDDGVGRTRLTREEARTRTDVRGEYVLEGLDAGTKRLTVTENAEPRTLAPVVHELALADEQRQTGFDIVLPAGLVLRGRVVDDAGVPLEGIEVSVTRRIDHVLVDQGRDTTTADGRFEIVGLPPGDLEVRIDGSDWVEQDHELRAGGAEHRFVLQAAPRIAGLVRDARNGRPLTDFHLRMGRAGGWLTIDRRHDDGRFDIPVWDDQAYEVTVTVGGYVPQTRLAVKPSDTAGVPLIFELQPQS